MYAIKLNDRRLTGFILKDYLGLSQTSQQGVSKLIDRYHKISQPAFISKLDEVLAAAEKTNNAVEKLLAVMAPPAYPTYRPRLLITKRPKRSGGLLTSSKQPV